MEQTGGRCLGTQLSRDEKPRLKSTWTERRTTEYPHLKRPMNDWMSDDILVLKALRHKYESLWRKTRLTVHFDMYSESCMDVKTAIRNSKSEILQKKISDCNGDQKKKFQSC